MFEFSSLFTIHQIPIFLVIGIMTFLAFYFGKLMKPIKLPSLIGFMLVGVLLGPSLVNLISEHNQIRLGFITDLALAFVALSIGLELKISTLKRLGRGIIIVILSESLMAFLFVTGILFLLTKNLPMSLIFGAIAPASAPAGTVAIIREYKAKGPLTQALYAVVGFDDGLGIILFGFTAAIAKHLIKPTGSESFLLFVSKPLLEILLSIAVGTALAFLYALLTRKTESKRDNFILLFVTIMIAAGLSELLHLSVILTNMMLGMVLVNTQRAGLISRIEDSLSDVMPLLFVLFFTLAGSNLDLAELPALGILGLCYILGRSGGLITGAWFGSTAGRLSPTIRRNLGLGILSQAGVAIGLALTVKNEFAVLGQEGMLIGTTVITTISATSIFFELVGPITTRIALKRAGEIGN